MGKKFAAFDAEGNITAFYDSVDSPVPERVSAVEIDYGEWLDLVAAQSTGKCLVLDDTGKPAAIDPAPPTRSEVAVVKRAERDAALHASDWLVSRHQDEKALGDGTTLTADQFALLLKYRQSLRECSDMPGWPNVALPMPPTFATLDSAASE
ncbi:phage tail assembly chaperone [Burkholderia vietnamiensis]|uniref:phage tail assembly chaperone n=1 Tax=Burkholderia vietnamiensis TaxID=60552 RepID=UPI0009C0E050|nr:phage tail assembly chaperone [Burkholderia vietnamiensis]WHU92000.1 phage tail assembly chaperone [Burkholderia vietnamiensis]HDR9225286.1 phage tail protein [Burkholderia vietnamiensis]